MLPSDPQERSINTRRGVHPARTVFFAFTLLVPPVSQISLHAGFSQASLSMASQALGGGFTAKADDAWALFLNPAGLSQLPQAEMSLMYTRPFAGIADISLQKGYAVVALPAGRRWTIAAGGMSFDADRLMTEQEGLVGVSCRVNRFASLGVNVGYLRHSYQVEGADAQDPLFANGRSKGAMGVDVGALLQAAPNVSFGLSARHLNRPDIGLMSEDRVPLELLGGTMVRLGQVSLLADIMMRDAGQDIANKRELNWGAGMAWAPVSSLDLRAGMNNGNLSTGVGIRMGALRLDYSFALSSAMNQDTLGGHLASMSLRFGNARPAFDKKSGRTRSGMKTKQSFTPQGNAQPGLKKSPAPGPSIPPSGKRKRR